MIAKITKAYVRTYTDNGQVTAYIEWLDQRNRSGRTEGAYPPGEHMGALLARAKREGVPVTRERW